MENNASIGMEGGLIWGRHMYSSRGAPAWRRRRRVYIPFIGDYGRCLYIIWR